MPIPLFFIGTAIVTGAIGGTKTAKAVVDSTAANKINTAANLQISETESVLDRQRSAVSKALIHLGTLKIGILKGSDI